MPRPIPLIALLLLLVAAKPIAVILPLSGAAEQELRDKVAASLRAKLDRDGTYDVIPGVTTADTWDAPAPTLQSDPAELRNRLKSLEPAVLIFGQLDGTIRDGTLALHVWDIRSDAKPRLIEKHLGAPTDLRFVAEDILQTLADVKPFEHPNELAVQTDAEAEALWRSNPNLAPNGTFDRSADWETLYEAQRYVPAISDDPPKTDTVVIQTLRDGDQPNPVLAMKLSTYAAENNGMACLSAPIPIQAAARYRLSFRYKSDGPKLHIFIKGYTPAKNAKGEWTEREIYRRQVPPTGATAGQWVTVVDELNPQHQTFPVTTLRIDLYAYLQPGTVMFDDIVLKAVGTPSRQAHDAAMDQPVTRPASRPAAP